MFCDPTLGILSVCFQVGSDVDAMMRLLGSFSLVHIYIYAVPD